MEIKITHTDALFEWCHKCAAFSNHDLTEKMTLASFLLSCFKDTGQYTAKCKTCLKKQEVMCKKRRAQFYKSSE